MEETATHDENVSETFRRITPQTPDQTGSVEAIKRMFTTLEKLVKDLTPETSYRQSEGMLHLEIAQMFFVKAVFDK